MSGIDPKVSPSDAALSAALREMAHSAPQGAPPDLGPSLARAFHRHHLRRRIAQTAIYSIVTVLLCGGLLVVRTGLSNQSNTKGPIAASGHEPAVTAKADSISAPPPRDRTHGSAIRAGLPSLKTARPHIPRDEPFVVLPAFALRTPDEELHVIRVEMPISSLRLLGAQVNDEIFTRRVTTDLLVGPDGTPYAFRLIT
jgi:hypothetical protein